ncbi:hypothetical protein DY000_02009016 [Brassica cretica]|uniref:Uncharacterized protein n=1 Tax=Brassica cretica TaxID=69181 RepID=A0ABQ7C3A9_BRACR|nr:hypothetical protein DY000_02009016 [Brassica cretica]
MAATKMVFHHMVLIFHSFKGFSDLEDFWARRFSDHQEVFRRPGSLLTDSSPMSLFHNRSKCFGFSDLGLIYMFFRSVSDFGRPMGSLLGSLLKYNALEDFQEVFQRTSKKSSRRLPGSLPEDFQEVFQTTSRKSSDGVFFHIKWSLSLSL